MTDGRLRPRATSATSATATAHGGVAARGTGPASGGLSRGSVGDGAGHCPRGLLRSAMGRRGPRLQQLTSRLDPKNAPLKGRPSHLEMDKTSIGGWEGQFHDQSFHARVEPGGLGETTQVWQAPSAGRQPSGSRAEARSRRRPARDLLSIRSGSESGP